MLSKHSSAGGRWASEGKERRGSLEWVGVKGGRFLLSMTEKQPEAKANGLRRESRGGEAPA